MAEVNANSLPAKTDLGTNDSAIVVDQTTNAGALVDLDVLADKVLDRLTSKTFANQVGGSSAATLLAQLSTLNSKIVYFKEVLTADENGTLTTSISAFGTTHYTIIGIRPMDRRAWFYSPFVQSGDNFWHIRVTSNTGGVGTGTFTLAVFAVPGGLETE